ncbi:oxidoreductase C-terminal domain-containing protein [Streptomyces sp. NPDC039016]|uniref:oxidoreductase C-terminal domain-containing protein n=1 Tax=Streptomyces sp. NPDC039016 TaxID=3154330 RepID=UPI0033CCD88F
MDHIVVVGASAAGLTQQAVIAAKNLLAGPNRSLSYAPIPFGWTDQYDTKIQIHGWCPPEAHIEVVGGDLPSRKFVALYHAGGRVVGALGWNGLRALLQYRGHIAQHTTI